MKNNENNKQAQMIGKKIRNMRIQTGMTQAQLASEINCMQPQIARIEKGQFNPNLSTLQKIANVFGFEIDFVKKEKLTTVITDIEKLQKELNK